MTRFEFENQMLTLRTSMACHQHQLDCELVCDDPSAEIIAYHRRWIAQREQAIAELAMTMLNVGASTR